MISLLRFLKYNFNLLLDRYYQISDHPEQIIPLFFTKVELRNTYWWGIIVVSSVVFHIKFTASENIWLNNLTNLIALLLTVFGFSSPQFYMLLGLQIININTARTTSMYHHSDGYAWISFEFFGWPYIGTYLHGYAQSGSTVYNFLFWPDIYMGLTMYLLCLPNLHNWRWISI